MVSLAWMVVIRVGASRYPDTDCPTSPIGPVLVVSLVPNRFSPGFVALLTGYGQFLGGYGSGFCRVLSGVNVLVGFSVSNTSSAFPIQQFIKGFVEHTIPIYQHIFLSNTFQNIHYRIK